MTTLITDHPRRYKVDRNVPGIDFGRDAVSYHRTLALAENAAERFWHDKRFVGWINRNAGDSFVNIYERDTLFRGYHRIKRITRVDATLRVWSDGEPS